VEEKKSLPMQDSPQPQTTELKRRKAGAPLGTVPVNKLPSSRPELVGVQYGHVRIISPEVVHLGQRHQRHPHVLVDCVTCGYRSFIQLTSLTSGASKGCRYCSKPRQIPQWLYARCAGMVHRCKNPNDARWELYGGRGIEFRFSGATACGRWIVESLGIPENAKEMELDRIDNNGHYEPGNIRWATRRQNMSNRKVSQWAPLMHKFTLEHPDIKYAEATLRSLISVGMSFEDIVARYHKPSHKPKGKYGTSLIADPEIASLAKGC